MFKASVTIFGSWKAYFPPFIISETYDIISGLVSLEIISNKTYCTLRGRLDPPEGARCVAGESKPQENKVGLYTVESTVHHVGVMSNLKKEKKTFLGRKSFQENLTHIHKKKHKM